MRTTINELVGRRGGAYSKTELESALQNARRLLADTNALLQLETERLFQAEFDSADKDRYAQIKQLLAQAQKCQTQILDIEAKVGLKPTTATGELDLEAARNEILGRLARFTG